MAEKISPAFAWLQSHRAKPQTDPKIKAVHAEVSEDGGCLLSTPQHGTVIIPADLVLMVGQFMLEHWTPR